MLPGLSKCEHTWGRRWATRGGPALVTHLPCSEPRCKHGCPTGRTRLHAACIAPGLRDDTSTTKHKPCSLRAVSFIQGLPEIHSQAQHIYMYTREDTWRVTHSYMWTHARAYWAVLARPRLITTIQLAIEAKRFSGMPACLRPRWLPIHLSSSSRVKTPSVQHGG